MYLQFIIDAVKSHTIHCNVEWFDDTEEWIGMIVVWNNNDLIRVAAPKFGWWNREKLREILVGVIGAVAEIRSMYLTNTSRKCCRLD
jgi:hypothetical protein